MNKTRIGALILVFTLVLGLGTPTVAVPAADIAGLACEEAVVTLTDLGILQGYPDGTFRPDSEMTRAEMTVVFSRILVPQGEEASPFTDTIGHWAEDVIAACRASGIVEGYEDGTFQPQQSITMLELATMTLRALGYTGEDYAAQATLQGLLPLDYNVNTTVTRGAGAILLARAIFLPLQGSETATLTATMSAKRAMAEGTILRSYVLNAGVVNNALNGIKLADDAVCYLWDSSANGYSVIDLARATYCFTAVVDTNGDKLGDTVLAADRADSSDLWDAGMQYADPRGGEYADAYNNAYNIPYGERLMLTADEDGFLGGAAVDYYNLVAAGDMAASTYWAAYDWYNTTSTDTLTILTGFKTIQQSNGWACGMTSALMAIDWYGLREDLNELDLGALRDKINADGNFVWGGATDTQMLINTFTHLNKMAGHEVWGWQSTYDFVSDEGELDADYLSTAWIVEHLQAGHPILVGWNSFGGHWQVIIGYDDMGTDTDADDVLILADPYDTTDHRNDGVNIQSYQRLYWDYTQNFDRDFKADNDYGMTLVFVAYPNEGFAYTPVNGDGLAVKNGTVWVKDGNYSDDMVIDYGATAADLDASGYVYAKEWRGENGLSGPASDDWYRTGDVKGTSYYGNFDFYNAKAEDISATLVLLEGFATTQQASEWTCGLSSMRMVLNHFDQMGDTTEFDLAHLRDNDIEGATTLDGLIAAFEALNAGGGDWAWLTTDDMDDDWMVAGLSLEGELFVRCLENGIPVIIGWDEWGGHWQVVIGYDDMGTEATQDDVLILADSYDTTDHNQDGYVIESFERLVYGWGARFDDRGSEVFMIAAPTAIMAEAGLLQ